MVKIRLRRMGAKKKPFYRIVVADSRTSRDGRFIENIGYYDPTVEPPVIKLEKERAEYWLANGAQPSDTARALLKIQGLMGGVTKKAAGPKKKAAKAKEPEVEEAFEAEVVPEAAPVEAAPEEAPAEEVKPKPKRTRKPKAAEEAAAPPTPVAEEAAPAEESAVEPEATEPTEEPAPEPEAVESTEEPKAEEKAE